MSKPLTLHDGSGVAITDSAGRALLKFGATVPSDGVAAGVHAPGCLFVDTTNGTIYVNETTTTADFNRLSTEAAQTFGAITVSSLTTSGDVTYSAAADLIVPAATAAALEVTNGTTAALAIDTRVTLKDVATVTLTGLAPTVATEAAAHTNPTLKIAAKTITYTGTTGTTSSLGAAIHIGANTWTDASMATLTTASAVHITANAAAGGMLTITNSRMISTSVSDCFLTNAGVWTDTACWESGKEFVSRSFDSAAEAIDRVLDQITPATWKYKQATELPAIDENGNETIHRTPINDRDRERVGIVYDDLPDALRAPGEERAVSPGILASFALAALKVLRDENRDLQNRLAKLEAA